jgi:hypothetical protein
MGSTASRSRFKIEASSRTKPRSQAPSSDDLSGGCNQSTSEPHVRLAIAPVIALARSEGYEGREVRDFVEGRKTLQQRAGGRTSRQHLPDGRAGSLGEAAEDLAGMGCGRRFRDRIRPQADDADAAGAELARQDARERLDGRAVYNPWPKSTSHSQARHKVL